LETEFANKNNKKQKKQKNKKKDEAEMRCVHLKKKQKMSK